MEKNLESELGEFVRHHRAALHLSTRDLAAAVDVHPSRIGRIETGEVANPKPALLEKIARALGVPVAQLYNLAGYPTPTQALPSLRPYMRQKYSFLTQEQLDQVEHYVESLAAEHRISEPLPGEDEA